MARNLKDWECGWADYLTGLRGWECTHKFSGKGLTPEEALNHPQSALLVSPLVPNLFDLESPRTQSRVSSLLLILSNLVAFNMTYKLCPKAISLYLPIQISNYLPDISIWMSEYLLLNISNTSLPPKPAPPCPQTGLPHLIVCQLWWIHGFSHQRICYLAVI